MSKNIETLKQDFYNNYKDLVPTLSIEEGSIEHDIFVNAPANVLIQPYENLDYLFALFLITQNPENIESSDIDQWAATYGEIRLPSIPSTVSCIFYRDTPPDKDILIPIGSTVSTGGAGMISFETIEEKTMLFSNPDIYYDVDTGKYGISILCQASEPGTDGNISSNLITNLVSSIPGITSVNNKVAGTGGQDRETNTDFISRVLTGFKGRNASVYDGIEKLVKDQTSVQDSKVIDATNPLMERDANRGRCIDIYIVGTKETTVTDNTFMTSTGKIILDNQPVGEIISIIGDISYNSSVYSLVKDIGLVKKSPKAQDYVLFSSTGIIPSIGEPLTIKYSYNELLTDLSNLLDSKENKVPNRDVLVRESLRIDITLKIDIILDVNTDPSSIQTAVQTVVSNYILPKLQSKIERADIIALVKSVEGVDNTQITELSAIDEFNNIILPDSRGDIILSELQYPILNTLEVTII